MNEKENISNIKNKINEELKNKELTELIVGLISFIILSGFFGYIGYSFCLDNNYDIKKGIVFSVLFPIGLALIKECGLGNWVTYSVYIIIYIIALDYIPTYVGIIVLFIIVLGFIVVFASILKKDRTEEINKIYKMQHYKSSPKMTYSSSTHYKHKDIYSDEIQNYGNEYEYECERCFEMISEEEYDLYDCMCEECFYETQYEIKGI